ncbi:MAG TPA: SURF1 family protein [Acidimicrobiia bacterium]|nr:SURF1 family protein [Acidimicrobiia bacterium]
MATFDKRVLLRPRWILAIVIAVVLVVGFVRLGMWQLDRLDERRASNSLIEERGSAPPVPLRELTALHGADPEGLIHRRAIVEGRYRQDLEFFSVGRTYGDRSGTLVATPFELADGTLMIVARGLVPSDTPGPPADGFDLPSGAVTITGRLDDGEEPLRIGEPPPDGGTITSISRIDLDYIDTWMPGDVAPISLLLDSQDPEPTGPSPVPIPDEELTEGSHLGYAIQWFAFALIVAIGVGYLVWRAGIDVRDPAEQETAPRP